MTDDRNQDDELDFGGEFVLDDDFSDAFLDQEGDGDTASEPDHRVDFQAVEGPVERAPTAAAFDGESFDDEAFDDEAAPDASADDRSTDDRSDIATAAAPHHTDPEPGTAEIGAELRLSETVLPDEDADWAVGTSSDLDRSDDAFAEEETVRDMSAEEVELVDEAFTDEPAEDDDLFAELDGLSSITATDRVEDELFRAGGEEIGANQFSAEDSGPLFREDGPKWSGADVDIGGLIHSADDDDEQGHEDVFSLDDVEVERLDADSDLLPIAEMVGEAQLDDIAAGLIDTAADDGADAESDWDLSMSADHESEPTSADEATYLVFEETEAADARMPIADFAAQLGLVRTPVEAASEAPDDDLLEGQDDEPIEGESDTYSVDFDEPEFLDDEAEVDPIYGSESAAAATAGTGAFELPEADSYEATAEYEDESYVDDTGDDYEVHVVGPGAGRRRGGSWWNYTVAAAAVLMLGAASTMLVAPDLLGLGQRGVVVDRTAVGRPQLRLDRAAPPLTIAGQPVVVDTTADSGAGSGIEQPNDRSPSLVAESTPEPGDAVADGLPPVDPSRTPRDDAAVETTDRPAELPPLVAVPPLDPAEVASRRSNRRSARVGFEPIEQGENLVLGGPTTEAGPGEDDVVEPGMRAFAQLNNDSAFVGIVRKIDLASVTLKVDVGEVTLLRRELLALIPFDESIGAEYVQDPQGYVEIANQHRLRGRIVHTESLDEVVLETDQSRVRVPKSDVVLVGSFRGGGIDISANDSERWLQDRARRRMQDRRRLEVPVAPIGGGR